MSFILTGPTIASLFITEAFASSNDNYSNSLTSGEKLGVNNQSFAQSKIDQLKAVCKTLAAFPSNNLTDQDCNNLSMTTMNPTNGSVAFAKIKGGFWDKIKDLINTPPTAPKDKSGPLCAKPPCPTIPK